MATHAQSYQSNIDMQSLNLVNAADIDALNDENLQAITAMLNSLTSELEGMLSPEEIESKLEGEPGIVEKFENLKGHFAALKDHFTDRHSGDDFEYHAATNSPIAEMMGILSQVRDEMTQLLSEQALMDAQVLLATANEQEQSAENSQHKHHFWGKMVHGLTYLAEGIAIAACVATGNIAAAAALTVLAIVMDTKLGSDVVSAMESAGAPAIVAKLVEAVGVIALTVLSAGAADMAIAGEVADEAVSMGAEDAGTELTNFASEEGEEEGANEAKKVGKKSLGKTLAGIGLMSGSSTLVQNNFAYTVAKHIDNKVLRDIVGIQLLLLEIAGMIAGGGMAFSGGADVANLGKIAELTNTDLDSVEDISELFTKIAAVGGATVGIAEGGLQLGIASHQMKLAHIMKNIELYQQVQNLERSQINNESGQITQVANSFEELFASFNFQAAADEMAQIFAQS